MTRAYRCGNCGETGPQRTACARPGPKCGKTGLFDTKKPPDRPPDPEGHRRLTDEQARLALKYLQEYGPVWLANRTGVTPDWLEKILLVGADDARVTVFCVLLEGIR